MATLEPRLLLLDREGTVLRSPPDVYVLDWDDVVLQQEAINTIVCASRHGFVPVLITNQSCVNHGLTTQAWVDEVNAWIVKAVREAGGSSLLALSCPHIDSDGCACRKPKPGLLHEAARLSGLSLATAWTVGNSYTDLGAARAAGVARFLHVCPSGGSDLCAEQDVECLPNFHNLTSVIRTDTEAGMEHGSHSRAQSASHPS